MQLRSGYDPEISACISFAERSVEGMYFLKDSLCADMPLLAVGSPCAPAQGVFFYIPAAPFDLGRIISIRIQNTVSVYTLDPSFPRFMDFVVSVSSRLFSAALSRVETFVRRSVTVYRKFIVRRPCVLRL